MAEEQDLRQEAIKRLHARRDFYGHATVYVVVNLLLIGVWAVTGGGYFWPAWIIVGWGIGLAVHGVGVFMERREPTEDRIRREMDRMRNRGTPAAGH